jgi:hypothetical protein
MVADRLRRVWQREGVDEVERPGLVLLAARTAAELRARQLLRRMLNPAQRQTFELYGYFAVHVARRGTFWILPSPFFNVLHAETGNCYCAVPKPPVPLSDLMLAQKLLLENDPGSFFAVANRRAELIPGLVDARLRPDRVMQARRNPPTSRIRWSEVPPTPPENPLP